MRLFRRVEITLRCIGRGTALSVPGDERLIDACSPRQRRRLRRRLARLGAGPVWSVEWRKVEGDALRPHEIVVVVRGAGLAVELVSARAATLVERLAGDGETVAAGARLGALRHSSKPKPPPEPAASPSNEVLRQFVSRQRRDAELIAALQAELAEHRRLAERLHHQIASLGAAPDGERGSGSGPKGGLGGGATAPDRKFRRIKQEFSKRFHPDAAAADPAERAHRERVFREFWPIVDQIDRS